jgi:hypothetical protein
MSQVFCKFLCWLSRAQDGRPAPIATGVTDRHSHMEGTPRLVIANARAPMTCVGMGHQPPRRAPVRVRISNAFAIGGRERTLRDE